MHIVFLSNYLNHHMLPLCLAMHSHQNTVFHFVATKEITSYRKTLGYTEYNDAYDFVICSYKNHKEMEKAKTVCNQCDILIYGSAPLDFVQERMQAGKLTFRYSERIYKKKCPWYEIPLRALKYNTTYKRNGNTYLLCASGYAASDYAKTGTFLKKAYKWGYFPEIKKYEDIQSLIVSKQPRTLLWVGRFLDWKHPEATIEVAKRLKAEGYSFELNIIGNGELEEQLKARIIAENLSDCVFLLGSMQPEQVREYMEHSEIFLFTSDRNEGWGAVLNESMNSACAVVASHAIGSVPFLIEDGKNGLIFKDGDTDDLYQKVKWLLDHEANRRKIAENAYAAMTEQWNAEVAAERLLKMAEQIKMQGSCDLYEDGPCSRAGLLQNNWYKATGKNLQ